MIFACISFYSFLVAFFDDFHRCLIYLFRPQYAQVSRLSLCCTAFITALCISALPSLDVGVVIWLHFLQWYSPCWCCYQRCLLLDPFIVPSLLNYHSYLDVTYGLFLLPVFSWPLLVWRSSSCFWAPCPLAWWRYVVPFSYSLVCCIFVLTDFYHIAGMKLQGLLNSYKLFLVLGILFIGQGEHFLCIRFFNFDHYIFYLRLLCFSEASCLTCCRCNPELPHTSSPQFSRITRCFHNQKSSNELLLVLIHKEG